MFYTNTVEQKFRAKKLLDPFEKSCKQLNIDMERERE